MTNAFHLALDQRERELSDAGLEPADAAPHGRPERRRVGQPVQRRWGGGARGHHRAELAARRGLRDGEEHLRAGRGETIQTWLKDAYLLEITFKHSLYF